MKALKILRSVLVWAVVALAVGMMIFTVVSVSTFDRADRNLFGYKAFIVLSDSMSKTDFDAGDLVLVREVDASTLQEGDIIAYTSQNTTNYGETVTHKIRRLTTAANGEPGFVTYGTTTDTDDETIVTYPYVLGKYQGHIPKVGTFFRFLKTPQGYIICILLPFLLLILIADQRTGHFGVRGHAHGSHLRVVHRRRQYRREQDRFRQPGCGAVVQEQRHWGRICPGEQGNADLQ